MALRVAVRDEAGRPARSAERVYGRILVDDHGPVPFYAATRLASDNRIAAMETRQEQFALEAQSKGDVEVTLVYVDIAHEIASVIDVDSHEEIAQRVVIPFGPRGPSGARAHLPKTVEP